MNEEEHRCFLFQEVRALLLCLEALPPYQREHHNTSYMQQLSTLHIILHNLFYMLINIEHCLNETCHWIFQMLPCSVVVVVGFTFDFLFVYVCFADLDWIFFFRLSPLNTETMQQLPFRHSLVYIYHIK